MRLTRTGLLLGWMLVSINTTFAQQPAWVWARSAVGDSGEESGHEVHVDKQGNIYAIGVFFSTQLRVGQDTLVNADTSGWSTDIFLVQYDAAGNLLRSRSFGGKSQDWATGMEIDDSGNVFIAGFFYSDTFVLGSDTGHAFANYSRIFIVKLDSLWNPVWTKFEKSWNNNCSWIDLSPSGELYVTGVVSFSDMVFDQDTIFRKGYQDPYLIKLDPSGNIIWTWSTKGEANTGSWVVAAGKSGAYITGAYSDTLIVGTTQLVNLGGSPYNNFFVAAFDNIGNARWARSAGGYKFDWGGMVDIDSAENVYVSGYTENLHITFGTYTVTNSGYGCSFLAKYDSSGQALWARKIGTNNTGYGTVHVSPDGYICYAGNTPIPIVLGADTLPYYGGDDILLLKLDANGKLIWGQTIGGPNDETIYDVAFTRDQQLIVTGWFGSYTLVIGPDTLISGLGSLDLCSSTRCSDFLMAKLDSGSWNAIAEPLGSLSEISVFPNPANGILTIESEYDVLEFQVLDLCGTRIEGEINRLGRKSFDASQLADGMYILLTCTERGWSARKFIKH